jgi:hypothetical protein
MSVNVYPQIADGLVGSCGGVLRGQGMWRQSCQQLCCPKPHIEAVNTSELFSIWLHITYWLCLWELV